MKQLKYDTADNVLRIDYPEEWEVANLTGLTATAKDTGGIELLAATAVTMFTATTLASGIDRYSDEVVFTAVSSAPSPGDSFTIVGVSGSEVIRVKGYDPDTLTVITEEPIENQYDAGNDIYGNFGFITVDTTDTDVFLLGIHVQILWTPTGTGTVTKELFEIARFAMDLVSLRARFQRVNGRAFKAFTVPTDKFSEMALEAIEEVKSDIKGALFDYDKVVGQSEMIQVVMAKMSLMWTEVGDDEMEYEHGVWEKKYNSKFAALKAFALWTDTNQDDVKDENEVQSHNHFFERRW